MNFGLSGVGNNQFPGYVNRQSREERRTGSCFNSVFAAKSGESAGRAQQTGGAVQGSRAEKSDQTWEEKRAEQTFYSVGPNAPDDVKKAWMEAAKETGVNGQGIMEDGKMSHLSQMTVMQAVRRRNGEKNWSDLLGNSADSALKAARQALYQLENPLVPNMRKSQKVQNAIAKEKEFYKSFIQKLKALQESS